MNYFGGTRRAPMNQDEFDIKFNYLKSARNRRHSDSFQQEFCFLCPFKLKPASGVTIDDSEFHEVQSTTQTLWTQLKTYFPIIDTILNYSPKEQLSNDLCAGACLGLYTVAQSLICAFLAGLPPISGLYTALVSTLLYAFLGTSTHSQLSSNLILAFFVRNLLERFSTPHDTIYLTNQRENSQKRIDLKDGKEQIDYVATVTFISAIFLATIYATRLKFLFSFVSKHLLAGFSFGLSIRVIFSQINHILHVQGHSCISELSFTMALLYAKAPFEKRNKCSLLATMQNDSGLTNTFPMVYQRNLDAPVENESPTSECVVSIFDCLEYLNLYNLAIFVCALMAIVFMRQLLSPFLQLKDHLPVPMEFFTETVALTAIGVVSSFVSGHPVGQSHNRNKIGVNADASSAICQLVIFLILIPVTLYAQSLFSYVPVCVFSAIIFNNAGEYLRELRSLTYYWYISRTDVSIFIMSAVFSCFLSDTSFAMFLSIGFGLLTVVCRSQWPKFQQLVNVTGSGMYYAEKNFYTGADLLDDPGISIVRFEASLLFHNTHRFCDQVKNACNEIKGQLLGVGIGSRAGSMKSNITLATAKEIPMRSTLLMSGDVVPNYEIITVDQSMTKVLIIDFSSTPVVDTTGLIAMRDLFEELAAQKTRLLFACVNSTIRHRFKISGGFDLVPKHYFFPSVQDAVLAAQQMGGGIQNFHMSVSMNGCRDLITLSNAPSNQDFINQRNAVESRMSIVETRFTPPLQIRTFQ